MNKWRKHPLELELAKLLKEFRILVKKFGNFFFKIPKNKMDKYIFLMETGAWLLLGISLVFRIGKF